MISLWPLGKQFPDLIFSQLDPVFGHFCDKVKLWKTIIFYSNDAVTPILIFFIKLKCSLWTERSRESQLIHLSSLPIHFFRKISKNRFMKFFPIWFKPSRIRDPRTKTSQSWFERSVFASDQHFQKCSDQTRLGSDQHGPGSTNFTDLLWLDQDLTNEHFWLRWTDRPLIWWSVDLWARLWFDWTKNEYTGCDKN